MQAVESVNSTLCYEHCTPFDIALMLLSLGPHN